MPAPIEIERIKKTITDFLESEGYEFVDLKIGGTVSRPVFEIYVDIEGGITAEDCGKIARSLRYRLDTEGFLNDGATFIVSSPGLDRVIKHEKDFARFAGKKVQVWLVEPINGRKKLKGMLKGQQDGSVLLTETEEGDLALAPGRWKEIRRVPEYPEGFK
ncbi:MAG: ribosome maturation factor RimP [bacterium]|nr:ribosome maturation factor RimP [bacterium]